MPASRPTKNPPPQAPAKHAAHQPDLEAAALSRLTEVETALEDLRTENREMRELLESVQMEMSELQSAFEDLRRDLGG